MGWWIAYARSGREFDVQEAIRAMGITAHVARKIEAIRRGKQRHPEPVESAYLPNYVFIDVEDVDWPLLLTVKHLSPTMQMVPGPCVPSVLRFLANQASVYEARKAKIEAGQRVGEYEPGDLLEVMGGPLAGFVGRFSRLVETSQDLFPRLKVEVELMGGPVLVDLDPLDARKARAA